MSSTIVQPATSGDPAARRRPRLFHEKFGPGKFTEAEDLQYWAECRRADEFQTTNLENVPRNRDEMRAYYERIRPRMAATEVIQHMVEVLFDGSSALFENLPSPLRRVVTAAFRKAAVATMPPWMRRLGGIRQGRLQDTLITGLTRGGFRLVALSTRFQLVALRQMSPHTLRIMEPFILGIPPLNPVIPTPTEAWERAGLLTPKEQYAEQLAARPRVVDAPGPDEGTLLAFA